MNPKQNRTHKMNHNYRNTDPHTSALAGRQVRACGCTKRHRDLCLTVVKRQPGLTACEIEARIGIKAHKRLPELRADKLVRNGPSRACTVSGRQAMTWLPPQYLN
jgi:hypothetical protein